MAGPGCTCCCRVQAMVARTVRRSNSSCALRSRSAAGKVGPFKSAPMRRASCMPAARQASAASAASALAHCWPVCHHTQFKGTQNFGLLRETWLRAKLRSFVAHYSQKQLCGTEGIKEVLQDGLYCHATDFTTRCQIRNVLKLRIKIDKQQKHSTRSLVRTHLEENLQLGDSPLN